MKIRISLVALCSLIFYCSAAYGQTPKKDERSAEWEYKQLERPSDELLNHYAKDGWEIAAAAGGGGGEGMPMGGRVNDRGESKRLIVMISCDTKSRL